MFDISRVVLQSTPPNKASWASAMPYDFGHDAVPSLRYGGGESQPKMNE